MDVIQTVALGLVMSAIWAVLAWMVHGLRTEMRQEIHLLREEMRALRSDLTQVALAVGAKPRAENA